MAPRTVYGYILIAFGLLLVALPLIMLASIAAQGEMKSFGIILIGPVPLILSSENPLHFIGLVAVFLIALAAILVLFFRAYRNSQDPSILPRRGG
ncbi:MAG: DUF131 domain-containing protein [Nitrososphaerota archaeon]